MYPAQFSPNSSQFIIIPIQPESSSMEIDSLFIRFEDHFKNINDKDSALIQENTVNFLTGSDTTLEDLLTQLTTPAKLLYSLTIFYGYSREGFPPHPIEKFFAYLTAIEAQFIDQLDNLIKLELQIQTPDNGSILSTLGLYIFKFREKLCLSLNKTATYFDPSTLDPTSIPNYTCLSYAPSFHKKDNKGDATASYHLPIRISQIALLCHIYKNEENLILNPHFSLKQTLLRVEKEMHEIMEISENVLSYLPWASYIELFNFSSTLIRFNYKLLDFVETDFLKKINKGINHTIFKAELPLFLKYLMNNMANNLEDLTPSFLNDYLNVLIKYNIIHEIKSSSEILSHIKKFISEFEYTSVEFSCDGSKEVDYVKHTFCKKKLKININPQIFSAGSEKIRVVDEWLNSLLDTKTTTSCTFPLKLLFPASLTGKKRKREESLSFSSSTSYRILRYPFKFLKTLPSLTLVGKPKQSFHPEEWNQLMNCVASDAELSLPLECLSENTKFPDHLRSLNIDLLMHKNETERKKQLNCLNQFTDNRKVTVTLDFENNEIPLEVLFDYAKGLPGIYTLEFENSHLAADFDLNFFLTQLKDAKEHCVQEFMNLACGLRAEPFTIDQINLVAQMNGDVLIDKLAKRVIDLIDSGEGDRLFSYPSMRKPFFIIDILNNADLNKDNSRLYKKLTSVLIEMTLEASNTLKSIPDPHSSCDAQHYLLECITKYPSLMDNYAEYLMTLFEQSTRNAPEHPLNGKITLEFLKNIQTRYQIERFLSLYSNFFYDISRSELAFGQCGHLLSVLNCNEVKKDLSLYPSTLIRLVSLLEAAFEDDRVLGKKDFLKQVEGIVTFMIKKEYLSKTQLETLVGQEFFADYLFSILRCLKTPEIELFVKRLSNVADLFWSQILPSQPLESKEDLKKLMALFFKQGWHPHSEADYPKNFRYYLIPHLRGSLPHLDENKQKWVLLILQDLVKNQPILSQEEQEGINELLEYFFISKERGIKAWDISGLKNYPIISKHLLTLCTSSPSLLKSLMGIQPYLDVWNTLFTDLLEKGQINEEEAFHYSHKFMRFIDIKEVFQNPSIITPLMTALCNRPMLQEKLLKKSYVDKDIHSKKIFLPISGFLARYVLNTKRELSEEILSLCAKALCNRKLPFIEINPDQVPCEKNRAGFLKALMGVLKNSEEYTLKNHPKLLISLLDTYTTEYGLYKSNPNSEMYQRLVEEGEVILTVILEANAKEPLLSMLSPLLEAEFEATPNVMRDVMNRLLESNQFLNSINSTNLRHLQSIITLLPTLSAEAQKVCFRLFKHFFYPNSYKKIFLRQPLYLNKRLNYLNKIHMLGERSEAVKLLCLPLRPENSEVIPKLLSKLAPLSESELMLICRSQNTHMSQCLGRELTEKEQWCLELSKYKTDVAGIQKVRRFIEKPHTPPIDVNQTSDIRSILALFDLINFNDPESSHYVNPSFLILDGKKIEASQFRGNIEGLINNVLKREKITAVPENDEERELFYRDLHQYLAHIAHIIGQQDPAACTASFLALGEIGAKCGTQYLELPGLYHSLVQQAEIPLVPHWISPQLIAQSAESLNNSLYKETSDGFTTRTAINHLKCFLSRDINNGLTFKVPLKDHEVRYYYALINKKASLIYYLLETFPSNLREEILAKIAKLELNSPAELLKELQKIEHVLSLAWLLPYRKKYDLDIESIRGVMSSLIQSEFKKEKESDVSKKFKKILNDIYTMDDTTAKQTITLLSEALTGIMCLHDSIACSLPKDPKKL